MSEQLFFSALEQVTAGQLPLVELIRVATDLRAAGLGAAAEQLYRVWIGFNPDHPQLFVAWYNLSTLPLPADRAAEAVAKAAELNPEFWPAYINLGGLKERSGDLAGAVEEWGKVIDGLPAIGGSAVRYKLTALKQLTRVLMDNGQSPRAEAYLQQCLDIDAKQRDAMEQYVGLRLSQCHWPVLAPFEEVTREVMMSGFSPLSMACFTDDPLLQLATAARYVEQSIQPAPTTADRRDAPIDLTGRRLRVGYASSDFRDHAIGFLMAELLELHDPARVETFVYYCGPPASGAMHDRYRAATGHWRDITDLDDEGVARTIAADEIDILVDINGHTRFARTAAFARRPAPIQVNWLGYPGTMGSPFHQYIIADDWIIPPKSEIYYSEKVVRLPCYQPNDRKRVVADHKTTRAEAGLPEDAFVYCCFNGAQKISRFTFQRWLEILKRTPGSVLWLLDSEAGVNERLLAAAEQGGVERARIVFAQKLANPYHLARYALADLFLDTAPYGAHTTCSDALWMGVPVLTLSGRSFASRVCGSLVRAAGLKGLICETPQDFVDRAVALASDPKALAAWRAQLEAGRATSTLFDMDRLVRSLEGLYDGMVEDYRAGRLPRPDLDNLAAYLAVGIDQDPEAAEMQAVEDYHGLYRAGLARRHAFRPLAPDARLWKRRDIAAAEGAAKQNESGDIR